jgi:hypothetical protein
MLVIGGRFVRNPSATGPSMLRRLVGRLRRNRDMVPAE